MNTEMKQAIYIYKGQVMNQIHNKNVQKFWSIQFYRSNLENKIAQHKKKKKKPHKIELSLKLAGNGVIKKKKK